MVVYWPVIIWSHGVTPATVRVERVAVAPLRIPVISVHIPPGVRWVNHVTVSMVIVAVPMTVAVWVPLIVPPIATIRFIVTITAMIAMIVMSVMMSVMMTVLVTVVMIAVVVGMTTGVVVTFLVSMVVVALAVGVTSVREGIVVKRLLIETAIRLTVLGKVEVTEIRLVLFVLVLLVLLALLARSPRRSGSTKGGRSEIVVGPAAVARRESVVLTEGVFIAIAKSWEHGTKIRPTLRQFEPEA